MRTKHAKRHIINYTQITDPKETLTNNLNPKDHESSDNFEIISHCMYGMLQCCRNCGKHFQRSQNERRKKTRENAQGREETHDIHTGKQESCEYIIRKSQREQSTATA